MTEGSYIHHYQIATAGIRSDKYVSIEFSKSTIEFSVTRNYGKIDDLLAYIGGFFSLIFFVLSFFFGSFNEYRYELMVAEQSFVYDGMSKNVRETHMGLLGYFKYQIFEWFTVLGCKLSWPEMEKIHEVREESTQQLDIRYIVNKLRYL